MYESRDIRRGDIYRVRLDTGWVSEQGATRPALVISSNIGNRTSPTVIVAYMTTKDHEIGVQYGPTKATGIPSYVCCEQIATVSKQRITGGIMGSLTPNEMKEVEDKLDEALDLGYMDDAPIKEKEREINALKLQMEELRSEILRLKTSLEAKADEVLTRDVELAVAKRMYEKAVGIIAAMKAEPDLPKPPPIERAKVKVAEQNVVEPKVAEPEPPKNPEPPKKEEPKLLDINSATFSQLRGIGLSNNLVLAVINKRPFKKIEDMKGVVNAAQYGIIKNKIYCVPVVVAEEPAPPKVEEPKVGGVKINVNTASAQEIHDVSGLSLTACFAITGKRKREGLFKSLDELVIPGRLSAATLEKYRDKFEV